MANVKKVQRDEYIRIRLSKEEKELIESLAKELKINMSRLMRNLTLIQAEQKLKNKVFYIPVIKAYRRYLEITNEKELLKMIEEED